MITMNELRRRMNACGATQEQMAAAAGCGQTTIGRILRGETDPALSTVVALVRFLDTIEGKKKSRRGRPRRPLDIEARVEG